MFNNNKKQTMEITHNPDGTLSYEAEGMRFCINPDEQLSKNFTLREMLRSNYAERLGIINLPRTPEIVPALRSLCCEVLQPLREAMGTRILLSSGYRTPCVNACVGGARNSQHTKGEAADIYCRTEALAHTYYNYIKSHLHYDQLILEHNVKAQVWWVHVSYTTRRALRNQAFEQNL